VPAGWLAVATWAVVLVGLGLAIALPEPLQLVLGTAAVIAGIATMVQPLMAVPLLLFAVPFGALLRGSADSGSAAASTELAVGAPMCS